MKFSAKKIVLMFLGSFVMFLFISCSGKKSQSNVSTAKFVPATQSDIVGTWKPVKGIQDGDTMSAFELKVIPLMIFKNDGQVSSKIITVKHEIPYEHYKIVNGIATVFPGGGQEDKKIEYKLYGKQLVLQTDEENKIFYEKE